MAGEIPSVGEAAKVMDGSIQRELSQMETTLRAEMERCSALIEGAPFANGLAKAAASWRRDMEVCADKIALEAKAVTKALLGKDQPEITQSVNPELAAAVASDPDRRKSRA